ncbi:MAG: TonB family protein [Bacteroidota bacterium]
MQIKKSREVDLERKKPTLFFFGLAMATALVLSAFEWQTFEEKKRSELPEPNEIPIFEVERIAPSFAEKKKVVTSQTQTKQKVITSIIDEFKFIDDELPMDELDFPDFEDEPVFQDIAALADPVIEEEPLRIADVMPQFPGGEAARMEFLRDNVSYTTMALDAGLSGKIHIEFTVGIDGNVKDIVLLKGLGGGLDEIALNAVRSMPKWNPGFHDGRPVSVRFVMPIAFATR